MGDGEIRAVGNNKDVGYFPKKPLGEGSYGTKVFLGLFQKKEVAMKRVLKSQAQFIEREVDVLCSRTTSFKHVVLCVWTSVLLPEDIDDEYHYLALELCAATLEDYISGNYREPIPCDLDVLRQVCYGLKWIHDQQIAHKDLRPQNILISLPDVNGEVNLKIADFGLSRKVSPGEVTNTQNKGALGWISAEMASKVKIDYYKADIFSLGCTFHYFLARDNELPPRGCHPFGDEALDRQLNIANRKRHISKKLSFTMSCLVESMTDNDPANRPTVNEVLEHPAFWSADKVIQFLGLTSNVLEPGRKPSPPQRLVNLVSKMEINADNIFGKDFRKKLTDAVTEHVNNNHVSRSGKPYDGSKVQNLLRVIRNLRLDGHYVELPEDVKNELGGPSEGFHDYFMGRFPKLLIHVWEVMKSASEMEELKNFYTVQVRKMDLQPTRRNSDDPSARPIEPTQEVPFKIKLLKTIPIWDAGVKIVTHDPTRPGSFAVAMEDSSIHVYDVNKGLVRIRSPGEPQKRDQCTNVVLVWNEKGTFLAAGRTNGQVLLWEWHMEVLSDKVIELNTCVRSMQWSRTDAGDVLQIVCDDKFVALRSSGEVISEFGFHWSRVYCCDWIGSSKFAVVAPNDESHYLVMYEVQLGNVDGSLKLIGETPKLTETITRMKCHPNGNLVAFDFPKGIVKIWDVTKSTNALSDLSLEDYSVCRVDCIEWICENPQDPGILASLNDSVITFWKFDVNWIEIRKVCVSGSVTNMKHLTLKRKLCLVSYKGVSVISSFPNENDEEQASYEVKTDLFIWDSSIDQSEDPVKILLGQSDGSVRVLQLNC